MQLSESLATLARRWYLVFLGLLVTVGLGWAAFQSVPPTYKATGSILLMPAEETVGTEGNPYLFLGGMGDALDVMIRRSNATEVREPLLDQFPGGDYTVVRDHTTASPIAVVQAEAPTADAAEALLIAGISTAHSNLAAMQDDQDVSSETRIQARDLVVDDEATADTKLPLQLALVVIAAGVVGTLMVTGFLDGLLTRRKERRRARPKDSAADLRDGDQGTDDTEGPSPSGSVAIPATEPSPPQLAIRADSFELIDHRR